MYPLSFLLRSLSFLRLNLAVLGPHSFEKDCDGYQIEKSILYSCSVIPDIIRSMAFKRQELMVFFLPIPFFQRMQEPGWFKRCVRGLLGTAKGR